MRDHIKVQLQTVENDLEHLFQQLQGEGRTTSAGMIEGARAIVVSVLGGRE